MIIFPFRKELQDTPILYTRIYIFMLGNECALCEQTSIEWLAILLHI